MVYCLTAAYWYLFLVNRARITVGSVGQASLDQAFKGEPNERSRFLWTPVLAAIVAWLSVVIIVYWRVFGVPAPELLREPLSIFLFTLSAGTFAIVPSEAPILLVKTVSDYPVLVYSALGKAASAVLIVVCARNVKMSWASGPMTTMIERIQRWTSGIPAWWVYAFCQSVPFMPMRLSTLFLGSTTTGLWTLLGIAVVCAIGTVIRMLLMLGLVTAGLATFQLLGGQL